MNEPITFKCPHCAEEIEEIIVSSRAEVTYACRVSAEVNLEELEHCKADYWGKAYLPQFRIDSVDDRIETLDHSDLELQYEEVIFYCSDCQSELPKQSIEELMHIEGEKDPF